MTVSTDGQICYGVLFDEGYEFPWEEECSDGIEDWWCSICKYEPPFELYDARGEYIDGRRLSDERIHKYHANRRVFIERHPLPVSLVNVCSSDYPIWILAIPSTVRCANRGYPKTFEPSVLVVSEDKVDILLRFCEEHGLEYTGEPQWWLSSCWG